MTKPLRIASAVGAFWLFMVCACLWLILREPWLGLSLASDARGQVIATATSGPSEGRIEAGASIDAIRIPGQDWISLLPADLNPEPSYLHTYRQLDDFFARQQRIHETLTAPAVEILWNRSQISQIDPAASRPMGSVAPHVWLQLGFAGVLLLVTGAALTRAPNDGAAKMLLLVAIGLSNCYVAHAIYSARELALSGDIFEFLIRLNHVSAIVPASGGSAAVLWYFPRPLRAARYAWTMLALGAIFAMAGQLRIVTTLNLGFRLPLVAMLSTTILLAAVQWTHTAGQPLHRAMLRWWMLPWFIGIGLYIPLLVIPGSFDTGPYAGQTVGWAFLTSIFVGFGLGITRFRLFYLNPLNLWVWGITGAACASCVVVLRYLLHDTWLATCFAIAIAGLAFFPLRTLLWRLLPGQRAQLGEALESIAGRAVGVASLADVASAWRMALTDIFRPAQILVRNDRGTETRLEDDETLDATVIALHGRLRLSRPFNGRGLYSPHDVAVAQAVGTLFSMLAGYWKEHARGEDAARKLVAQMLHARIGTGLNKLKGATDDAELAQLLETAEARLQFIVSALEIVDASLDKAIHQWQMDFAEICGAAGIATRCVTEAKPNSIQDLSGAQMTASSRLVQEAATNIVRHSGASDAQLTIRCDGRVLELVVEDDGEGIPDTAVSGRGLRGLQRRSALAGGELSTSRSPMGGLMIRQRLPLVMELPVPHSGDPQRRHSL